jgi:tetratricopeptide (TPR) repeat protein
VKERRTLVNSIVERARVYEEQGQFVEALGQWDILRNIYGQYPGLDHEFRRVQRRREEHAREEAKATWVEKIDRALVAGRNNDAKEFTETALREFPGDGELIRLQEQASQAAKRSAQAEALVEEAQELSRAQNHAGAVEKLREARQSDEKNPNVLAALESELVEQARNLASKDWRAALPYVEEALQINAADPGAKNASLLVEDARRREMVERYLMEGRELQTAGKLQAALAKIEHGLREHPNDMRLAQLSATLRAAIDNQAAEQKKKLATKAEAPVANPPDATAYAKPPQPESRGAKPPPLEATALFSVPESIKTASGAPKTSPLHSPAEIKREEPAGVTAPLPVSELPQLKRRAELRRESSEGSSLWKKLGIAAAVVMVAVGGFLYYNGIGRSVKTPAPVEKLDAATPPMASGGAAAPATGNPGHAKASVAKDAQEGAPAAAAAARQSGPPVMFHFTSTPVRARVTVDNNQDLVCQTPCYLPLAEGRHTLTVSAPDYEDSKRVVRVPEQNSTVIALDEPPENTPAEEMEDVQFDSVPTGASIFIDGLPKGRTPATLRLPAGSHQVRVVNDAWKHDATIDVEPDSPHSFTYTLGP